MAFPTLFSLVLTTVSFASVQDKIRDASHRAHLDSRLVTAIVAVESNFHTLALSDKGAQGLMQVMPRFTDQCEIHSPFNPIDNLMGACDCLRRLINRYRGNIRLALAAYNAGPTQVDRYKGIPPFPETREYVDKVMSLYQRSKNS